MTTRLISGFDVAKLPVGPMYPDGPDGFRYEDVLVQMPRLRITKRIEQRTVDMPQSKKSRKMIAVPMEVEWVTVLCPVCRQKRLWRFDSFNPVVRATQDRWIQEGMGRHVYRQHIAPYLEQQAMAGMIGL